MTTAAEGAELTLTGPGTPMGELMRLYWMPALKSSELERDGPPVRFMLLGEKLIAFRDSSGKVGVMDHRCPHRGASLFLGRNEEGGIRCLYHGWKFDTSGQCIDMPSVPRASGLQAQGCSQGLPGGRARRPRLGLHGRARGAAPARLPDPRCARRRDQRRHDPARLQLPAGDRGRDRHRAFRLPAWRPRRCQPVSTRASRSISPSPTARPSSTSPTRRGARSTPATAPAGQGRTYWRFANFLLPFWTQAPNGEFDSHAHARAWVPIDDNNCMYVFIWWKRARLGEEPAAARLQGRHADRRHRPRQQAAAQHHRLDGPLAHGRQRGQRLGHGSRGAAHQRIYSGIDGIHLQDQAITESMGPIVDHTFEHLGPSDQMITRTRRRLLRASRALRERAPCRPASRTAASITARAAATSSATTSATGTTSTSTASTRRCIRRPRRRVPRSS